jgi:hypothetical protein
LQKILKLNVKTERIELPEQENTTGSRAKTNGWDEAM